MEVFGYIEASARNTIHSCLFRAVLPPPLFFVSKGDGSAPMPPKDDGEQGGGRRAAGLQAGGDGAESDRHQGALGSFRLW